MRVLLVDIGNSRIKWRVADLAEPWSAEAAPHHAGVVAHAERGTLAARWQAVAPGAIGAAYLANVADDSHAHAVGAAIRAVWGEIAIHNLVPRASQCGVVNGYRDPAQLGADRWALLIGAHARFPRQTLVIASLGTATTIALLTSVDASDGASNCSSAARFEGGLILPGIEAMRRSLARDTARLPLADGRVVAFADNTDDAIASGIVSAQAGAISRAMRDATTRLARTGGALRTVRCILTGGAAGLVAPHLGCNATIENNLVLQGLFCIAGEETTIRDTGDAVREPVHVSQREA